MDAHVISFGPAGFGICPTDLSKSVEPDRNQCFDSLLPFRPRPAQPASKTATGNGCLDGVFEAVTAFYRPRG